MKTNFWNLNQQRPLLLREEKSSEGLHILHMSESEGGEKGNEYWNQGSV